jgi:phosphatidyl-myo-inositol alpha-mannosyltransferase
LKVALVCPYAWDRPGGVQSHVASLAGALRTRRHDVIVIAPRSGRRTGIEDGVKFAGRTIGVPANGSVAPLAFGPAAAVGVGRALSAFDPEVVHLHEPLIPSLSLLALLRSNAPAVGTFHAAATASTGYYLARPVLAPAMKKLEVRTAVSDAARHLVSRYFPGEYLLTPNGVDSTRFSSAKPNEDPDRNVLFLGRIERRKGLETLIQAMARLRDLEPTLVVAGTGPQGAHCRRLASQLRVATRWLGRVPDGELGAVYKSARVYCAPGLGGESFGIVLIEAMAAGTPLVCSDLAGFRSVASGVGELVPPGDAGRLADALRTVLTDDTAAQRMSTNGLRVAAMYDWRRLVSGVEAVYDRAITRAAAQEA